MGIKFGEVAAKAEGTTICRYCYQTPDKCICFEERRLPALHIRTCTEHYTKEDAEAQASFVRDLVHHLQKEFNVYNRAAVKIEEEKEFELNQMKYVVSARFSIWSK